MLRVGGRAVASLVRTQSWARPAPTRAGALWLRAFATENSPTAPLPPKGRSRVPKSPLAKAGTKYNVQATEENVALEKADMTGIDLSRLNLLEDVVLECPTMDATEREHFNKLGSFDNANARDLSKARIAQLVEKYQRFPGDCGSPEVSIAVLTHKLDYLTKHLAKNKKDKHNQTGRDKMWHKRRKLLLYLRRDNFPAYERVVTDFNIDEHEILTYGHLPGRLNRQRLQRGWDEGTEVKADRLQVQTTEWEAERRAAGWSEDRIAQAKAKWEWSDRKIARVRRWLVDPPVKDMNKLRRGGRPHVAIPPHAIPTLYPTWKNV